MGQIHFYKGVAADYDKIKDKIADGGLVMVKENDSSVTGSLYINDNGTHLQVSTDEAIVEMNYLDGSLQAVAAKGDSPKKILTVDSTLDIKSDNPIQNKVIAECISGLNNDIATKINISDIVDNLVTNEVQQPLSAAQGVVIKNSIDSINNELNACTATITELQNNKAEQSALSLHIGDKLNPHEVTLSHLGVTATAMELNHMVGVTSNIQEQINTINEKSTASIQLITWEAED